MQQPPAGQRPPCPKRGSYIVPYRLVLGYAEPYPREPGDKPELPDFRPVLRHDGWPPERQRAFIDALADTGSVKHAAKVVNMSSEDAYYLRRQPGAEEFAAAWLAALDHGIARL